MNTPPLAALHAREVPDTLLTEPECRDLLAQLPGWSIDNGHLCRTLRLADFHQTMALVNAVAWIAHRADHHPDMEVGYNRCTLRWRTHSADGLTLKDMICAAQVDALQCPQA